MKRRSNHTVRRQIFFVIGLCLCSNLRAQGPSNQDRPGPQRLTVATYNVQNLLDVFDDPYTLDEKSPVKPREKIEKLAKVIRSLDADVIAVQEVEHEGLLRVLVHDLLGGMGYGYTAVEPTNSYHGANLGVISRLPILSLTSHRQLDLELPGETRVWRFARDLLRVRVKVTDERSLDLFIVHFKHGDDARSKQWREAEARATKRIVSRAMRGDPGAWMLVVGDFNDTPGSQILHSFLQPPDGLAGWLTDLHAGLKRSKRTTFLAPPRRGQTIDYILASPALVEGFVSGSGKAAFDPASLTGSDHAPVVATFRIADTPQPPSR